MAKLEDLLVDRAELDRALLADVLLPYVGIDSQRQEIVPRDGWADLGAEARILLFLLGRKALSALGSLVPEEEGALPREVEAGTGVRGNTLRPTLTKLRKEGLIRQDSRKRYLVPAYGVESAKNRISGGGANGSGSDAKSIRRRPGPRRRRR
jgi:hypothetical protein